MQKLGRFVLPVIAVLAFVTSNSQSQSVRTHHVRDAVRSGQAQVTGRLPGNQVLQLDLVLQLSDKAGLESFVKDLYDPTSPSYRHFLTPQEFTARFGPTQDDYDSVVRFAKTYGFQVVGGSRDAMDVQVKGTVSNIEAAFHVNMRTYQHPTENRAFYGPDNEPILDLPFSLWHVSGLDNYSIPHPMLENKEVYAQAHGIDASKVVSHATTGSGPSASFLGSDMRAAYYGGSLTGAGQKVGLLEYYGTDLADLNTYFSNIASTGQTAPASGVVSVVSTDGTSTSCVKKSGCDDTEQTLDMTQALGMAPGLSSLKMYVGSTDTAIIGAMTTDSPLPGTIGCSWGWTPADPTSLDPYFQKMAAQGQNFFVASGDSSTWSSRVEAWPADDPNVVAVGGTDLVTSGAGGAWSSETAWVDSGGGISPDRIAIPTWQKLAGVITSTNKGSTTLRNGPDVSANANFTFYVCADQTTCTANSYGGTSFAAPMWAAYIALVNQQLAANSQPSIGFINPTIYAQNVSGGALSGAYSADFHDVTSGTSGSYSATTGYDLVTGWGSPNTGLFAALTGAVPTSGFTLSASAVSVAQGTTGASTVTSTPFGKYSSTIQLSVSGLPSGVSVLSYGTNPFGPSGSTTISFSAAANATPGTYSVTVTGTGTADGTVQTTTVSLTVTALPLIFTIKASSTALTVSRGSSGTTTISTAVSQGSISSITLSASGQKSGTSTSFSPSSISGGTGSATLKFTVSSRATTGTYTITVKGTGGTVSKTAAVTLTVK